MKDFPKVTYGQGENQKEKGGSMLLVCLIVFMVPNSTEN